MGSSRASSLPSRRIWFGSALVSGRDELGLEVVVLARDLGQLGVEVAHDSGGDSPGLVAPTESGGLGVAGGIARLHRRAVEVRGTRRDLVAVGDERLLHRGDGDLDHVVGRVAWS